MIDKLPASNPAATNFVPLRVQRSISSAPLPMTQAEAHARGWDQIDIVFVTGDAYVDHPSFAMAILGRVLEAQGFRVGIVAQPDWHNCDATATDNGESPLSRKVCRTCLLLSASRTPFSSFPCGDRAMYSNAAMASTNLPL